MSDQSVDTVRGMYDAFGQGDVNAILSALDENIEWSVPENLPHGRKCHGREEVGLFFQGIGEQWDGLDVEIEAIVGGGDHVVALANIHGRLRGSGQDAGYTAAHAWTLQNGAPVRFDEYVNAPLSLPTAPGAHASV